MRRQYHYNATAAIVAEALRFNPKFVEMWGGKAPDLAAFIAINIARSNQMVDEMTPSLLFTATAERPLPLPSQVDPKSKVTAAMLACGDQLFPLMFLGDKHHFDPQFGWAWIRSYLGRLIEDSKTSDADRHQKIAGAGIHTSQDTEEDGPHEGYKGWPHKDNLALSEKRLKARGKKLSRKIRFLRWIGQSDEAWGHMADPDADNVENCRKGAVLAGVNLYQYIASYELMRPIRAAGHWVQLGQDGRPLTSLSAVREAVNDAHLEELADASFLETTGLPLPRFKRFKHEELRVWMRAKR